MLRIYVIGKEERVLTNQQTYYPYVARVIVRIEEARRSPANMNETSSVASTPRNDTSSEASPSSSVNQRLPLEGEPAGKPKQPPAARQKPQPPTQAPTATKSLEKTRL